MGQGVISPFTEPSPTGQEHPGVRWLYPVTVEVDYREHSRESLRHPSYKGKRLDIDPRSVRVEDL